MTLPILLSVPHVGTMMPHELKSLARIATEISAVQTAGDSRPNEEHQQNDQ